MNPFAILGIKNNASLQEAKEAFRRLAMKFHPDRVPESEKDSAEEQFKAIKQALEDIEGGYTYVEPQTKQAAQPKSFKTRAGATQSFYNTYSGVDTTEDTTILAYQKLNGTGYEAYVPLSAAANGFVLEAKVGLTAYRVKIPAGIPNGTLIEVGPQNNKAFVEIKFKSSTLKTILASDAAVTVVSGDEVLASGVQRAEITIGSKDYERGTSVRLCTSFGESVYVIVPKYHQLNQPIVIIGKGYYNWNRTKKKAESRNNLYVYVSVKDPAFVQATNIGSGSSRYLW
jgi:DnaJ-class molecular chaperone